MVADGFVLVLGVVVAWCCNKSCCTTADGAVGNAVFHMLDMLDDDGSTTP